MPDSGRPRPPYFDAALDRWVLSRYRDVAAALRDARLVPAAPRSTAAVAVDGEGHARFRAEALRALSPARLCAWEAQFAAEAERLARALPGGPADLVGQYAVPWSRAVAGIAAGVPEVECERLCVLARDVFEAACEPFDASLDAASQKAAAELACYFRAAPPWNLQMFVALCHSLPAFLGCAWQTLLEHPAVMAHLRAEPALLPQAIEELLRLAGPARAQFRQAAAEVAMEGCAIRPSDRAVLRLDLANRDGDHFPDPNEFLFGRSGEHLAFGGGLHACVAGMLIRSAAAVATRTLLARFRFAEDHTAAPVEGFAVRYLRSLEVVCFT